MYRHKMSTLFANKRAQRHPAIHEVLKEIFGLQGTGRERLSKASVCRGGP